MRRNDLIALGILTSLLLLSILNVVFGFLNQYILFGVVCVLLLLSIVFLGFHKNKNIIEKDFILSILIALFSYYLVTYLLGLFIGFTRNIYGSSFKTIVSNVFPVLILIISGEILRYIVNDRIKYKRLFLFYSFIVFFAFNSTITLGNMFHVGTFNTNNAIAILGLSVIPTLIANIFLTYMSSHVGYKSSIIYRILVEIPIYLIPIQPRFGNYIDSVFRITIPTVFLIWIYMIVEKKQTDKILIIKKRPILTIFRLIVFGFVFLTVYLVSGLFRYQALVIATGSMSPSYNIGDVVIVDKHDNKNMATYKVGQTIAYTKDDKIVCHRVVKIIKSGDSVLLETKGDSNSNVDHFLVEKNQVVGTVKYLIRYIGYPTVWLNSKR